LAANAEGATIKNTVSIEIYFIVSSLYSSKIKLPYVIGYILKLNRIWKDFQLLKEEIGTRLLCPGYPKPD